MGVGGRAVRVLRGGGGAECLGGRGVEGVEGRGGVYAG